MSEQIHLSARQAAQRKQLNATFGSQLRPVVQKVRVPGEYTITADANLRARHPPHDVVHPLKRGDRVTIKAGAQECRFSLGGFFSPTRDHTWAQTVNRENGWVKDDSIALVLRDEVAMVKQYFDQQADNARAQVRASPGLRDRIALEAGEMRGQQRLIERWVPANADRSNLQEFVRQLNNNICSEVTYIQSYKRPQALMRDLDGDCRSFCEINKFIVENVLGAGTLTIESANKGVREAANHDNAYTNHHWLNVGGWRFDAMENRPFNFAHWEVRRNGAWRAMTQQDVIDGISE